MLQARGKRESGRRDIVLPGTAVCFSLLMLWLAPNYPRWFAAGLPAFTQGYLHGYPLWIAITSVAFALAAIGDQLPLFARQAALRRVLDGVLTLAAILIVVSGIIALALPLLVPPEPP